MSLYPGDKCSLYKERANVPHASPATPSTIVGAAIQTGKKTAKGSPTAPLDSDVTPSVVKEVRST